GLASLLRSFAEQPGRTVYDRAPREKPAAVKPAASFEAKFAAEPEEQPAVFATVKNKARAGSGSDESVRTIEPESDGSDQDAVSVSEPVAEAPVAEAQVDEAPAAKARAVPALADVAEPEPEAEPATEHLSDTEPQPEPAAPAAKTSASATAPPAPPGLLLGGLLHEDGTGHSLLVGDE